MSGSILETFLKPVTDSLTPEVATRILQFQPDEDTQKKVDALAEKSQTGEITSSEREEYLGLIKTFDLVAIFKSQARKTLSAQS